jgi:hypothetical protein
MRASAGGYRRNNGVGDHEHSMVYVNTCHARCCRCMLLPLHPMAKVGTHVARAAVATATHSVGKHVSYRVLLSPHALLYGADEHALLPPRRKTSVCVCVIDHSCS